MLRNIARGPVAQACWQVATRSVTSTTRCMGIDGVKSMKERESALENLYFSKEDEKLLRNLLKKMKEQADATDKQAASHNEAEGAKLKSIVTKYKMSEEDMAELLKWKHSH